MEAKHLQNFLNNPRIKTRCYTVILLMYMDMFFVQINDEEVKEIIR